MKTAITLSFLVLASLFSAPGTAAGIAAGESGHGNHSAMHPQASPETQMVDGVVKKVDKAAGKVTLSHGPLLNLGMNTAMTMVFLVKDPAWLNQMKDGDRIRFMADNRNGSLTVIRFEPVR